MKWEETNNDNLEKQLREEAEDFLLQPSERVWEGIQSQTGPQRRRYAFWWIAAAAILLFLGLGTWFILQQRVPEARRPDLTQKTEKKIQQTKKSVKPTPAKKTEKTLSGAEKQLTRAEPGSETGASKRTPSKIYNKRTVSKGLLSAHKAGNPSYNDFLPFLKSLQPAFEPAEDFDLIKPAGLAFSGKIVQAEKENNKPEQAAKKVNQPQVKKEKKVSWQLYFTPGISYRNFTLSRPKGSSQNLTPNAPVQGGNRNNTIAERHPSRKKIEHRKDWGWEAGIRASLDLKKGWIAQTGLSVARLGYSIHAFGSYPVYVSNNGNASITNAADANSYYASYFLTAAAAAPAPSATFLQNSYLVAELPLLIGKQFGDPQKTSFLVLAGPGLTYMLGSNSIIYAPVSGRYFTNKDYLKPLNLNLRLEASFHVPLSKYLQLTVGPSFQYQILSTYKNYPEVKEHPYLIGIKTGVQLKK